jgi:hypothetical protein
VESADVGNPGQRATYLGDVISYSFGSIRTIMV